MKAGWHTACDSSVVDYIFGESKSDSGDFAEVFAADVVPGAKRLENNKNIRRVFARKAFNQPFARAGFGLTRNLKFREKEAK